MQNFFEYIVVGAGVSGSYIAWRLASLGIVDPKSIIVYEKNDWVGGRLYSKKLPGLKNNLTAEMGGLCFPSSHRLVTSLAKYLNLETHIFTPNWRKNHYYLKGTFFSEEDVLNLKSIPFDFGKNELSKSHGVILNDLFEKFIPGISSFSHSQWKVSEQHLKFDNTDFYNMSFWDFLKSHLSSDAYQYIQECYCYNSTLDKWSAPAAISWYLSGFPKSLELFKEVQLNLVKGGYQSIPLTLMEKAKSLGVQFKKSEVLGFDTKSKQSQLIEVNLAEPPNNRKHISCKNLILAMPKHSLQSLQFPSEYWGDIKENLETVTAQPVFRLFLTYESSWWNNVAGNFSKTCSDELIREIYYWDAGKDSLLPNYGSLPSIMINILEPTSKENETYISYMSILSKFEHKLIVNSFSDLNNCNDVEVLALLSLVRHKLEKIHNLTNIPNPTMCVYANWTDNIFGGMWHTWNAGVKYWEIMEKIRRPHKDKKVFICGEAYAEAAYQGWVEGALHTAEDVLQKELLLPPPSWL